jgi:hypothetical protein
VPFGILLQPEFNVAQHYTGLSNLINLIVPFYLKYVVCYSCKFNDEEFNKFIFILNKIKIKNKNKIEFIDLVKLVYNLNPSSKGKHRKRSLSEVIKNNK